MALSVLAEGGLLVWAFKTKPGWTNDLYFYYEPLPPPRCIGGVNPQGYWDYCLHHGQQP